MPNVMVALPNIGGALCSTPQSLADAHYQMPCSNAAKTRNQLKFAGLPQTGQPISAVSGPKFAILWGHVENILLLFYVRYMLSPVRLWSVTFVRPTHAVVISGNISTAFGTLAIR